MKLKQNLQETSSQWYSLVIGINWTGLFFILLFSLFFWVIENIILREKKKMESEGEF